MLYFKFEYNYPRAIKWAPTLNSYKIMFKCKPGIFKFLRFQERFQKAPFLRRFSVDGRPNRKNKAACVLNFLWRRVDAAQLSEKAADPSNL